MDVASDNALEIQSGLGHRVYRGPDLRVPRLVPLAPQVPLAGCVGSGELTALAAHVSSQVAAFDPRLNFFHAAGQGGGRFVFRDEPLEWGGSYRLLAHAALSPPASLLAVVEWSNGPTFGGWHTYNVSLPTVFPASRPDIPSAISGFFGKRIRPGRPRAHIVLPAPHHIGVDGTYVYPESPEYILVRRTVRGKVALKGAESAEQMELSEEWIRVEAPALGAGEYVLAIEGSEQVLLRVEACALFQPTGVRVSSNDFIWDLCTDAPMPPAELQSSAVSVECGSERIASYIGRANDNWVRNGQVLSLPAGAAKSLKAGSFGDLRSTAPVPASATVPQPLLPAEGRVIDMGVRAWIEGHIAERFGHDGVLRIRAFFADPSDSNMYRLGPIMLSPMMPYVRAALGAK